MTPFYYYALILTLGLFMYYAALIAKDMYGKPKGEGNTSESIETDGMTEYVHNNTPSEPSVEANDNDSDTDDESGSREWNEEDDKEGGGDGDDSNSEVSEPEDDNQNPDTTSPENAPGEPVHHNDEPEQSEEQQPSPRPYYEDDDDEDHPKHDEAETANENHKEVADNADDNASNGNDDNGNTNEQSQGNQFSQSALGLTPELIAYMEQHGSMVVNDAKPVEDLDLKTPEPEPEYAVTKTYEPQNEDAQMVAGQANSCQEKIEPKSDNAVPCGVLNKMFNKRLNNALSDGTDNVNKTDPTNNILSRHVQERC